MTSRWTGNGPIFEVSWGANRFRVDTEATHPGLAGHTSSEGSLLSLHALADLQRFHKTPDDKAFGVNSLHSCERRFDFVEAVYVPTGWHSLRVRARWIAAPNSPASIDLEVQLQADTVDELRAVEVHVRSNVGQCEAGNPAIALFGSEIYLDMSHPDDTSKREFGATGWIQSSLFGYDLERGVVLRGRLKGIILPSRPDSETTARLYDGFVNAPLPLGP